MLEENTARSLDREHYRESGTISASAPLRENVVTMPGKSPDHQSNPPNVGGPQKEDAHMEDFATALESYTLETEPAPSEDNVFKGSVVKITPTHVVVDIGFKSEGLVPIAEVTDAHGNVKFQPGQDIEVMVQRGENEEGSVLLSHERAQRVR